MHQGHTRSSLDPAPPTLTAIHMYTFPIMVFGSFHVSLFELLHAGPGCDDICSHSSLTGRERRAEPHCFGLAAEPNL